MVELLLVVVLLGLIAALASRRYGAFAHTARVNAAVAEFRQMDKAFSMYHAEYFAWPADQREGVFPPEMAGFLPEKVFSGRPTGGVQWDWNEDWGPVFPAIAIRQVPAPTAFWRAVDARLDDGNLRTGRVQEANNQLHYSLEP